MQGCTGACTLHLWVARLACLVVFVVVEKLALPEALQIAKRKVTAEDCVDYMCVHLCDSVTEKTSSQKDLSDFFLLKLCCDSVSRRTVGYSACIMTRDYRESYGYPNRQ